MSILSQLRIGAEILYRVGPHVRSSHEFQWLLKSREHFDVILVESIYCQELIGLGHHFNAPVISISSMMNSPEMIFSSAMPTLASFMRSVFGCYSDQMSFMQRLHNQMTFILMNIARPVLNVKAKLQSSYELMFVNSDNSLEELTKNVSMILTNSHPSQTASIPLLPNIIEIGGLPIRPETVQALPNDLQLYLDGAESGAIYFALGTIVNLSLIKSIDSILDLFGELSDIKFLVQANENFSKKYTNVPANVLIRTWLPQKAILKHPNMKCFISHAGHNSIQESIYYGKPLIVFPFVFDQLINAQWATEKGFAIHIPHNEITQSALRSAITNILHNSRFVKLNFRL